MRPNAEDPAGVRKWTTQFQYDVSEVLPDEDERHPCRSSQPASPLALATFPQHPPIPPLSPVQRELRRLFAAKNTRRLAYIYEGEQGRKVAYQVFHPAVIHLAEQARGEAPTGVRGLKALDDDALKAVMEDVAELRAARAPGTPKRSSWRTWCEAWWLG